jgi:hypothetical protein
MLTMLTGRDYRKSISQALAYLAFRFLALWLIILICAGKGQTGIVCGLVIAAVDIMILGDGRHTSISFHLKHRADWLDRLTNRMFFKLLIEAVRDGHGSQVDVNDLLERAAKDAQADINSADEASNLEAGFLGTTWWHWLGGTFSFIWLLISSALYYGSALYLGSGGAAF